MLCEATAVLVSFAALFTPELPARSFAVSFAQEGSFACATGSRFGIVDQRGRGWWRSIVRRKFLTERGLCWNTASDAAFMATLAGEIRDRTTMGLYIAIEHTGRASLAHLLQGCLDSGDIIDARRVGGFSPRDAVCRIEAAERGGVGMVPGDSAPTRSGS